ncbi:hypothetical protein BDF21DRAFT_490581 [Thamnidium elegans]|nr:hypothetical protein BDF21DRAFT_490581 [Thamnidium elegans]
MKKYIVITNVDSLAGYAIAYEFVSKWNRSSSLSIPVTEFRLLCHKRQGLQDLEKLGGKVIEMKSFDDKKEMKAVMKDVYCVFLIPEYSSNRLKEGEAIIHAAKEEGVGYMTMLSYLGIDKLEEKITTKINKLENLNQYLELEKKVADNFDYKNYCIIQAPIFHQFFYYFGPMIEDHDQIQLTIKKHKEWCSIDLGDLATAVFNLSYPDYCQDRPKKNQILFKFTGRHIITAEQLVEYASEGLERKSMTYKQFDSQEMYNYLHRIHGDNRFRERPNHHSLIEGKDRSYLFPLGEYLNDNCIKTLIEYWNFVDTKGSDKTSDDLEQALRAKSQTLKKFFKNNKDQFQRLR